MDKSTQAKMHLKLNVQYELKDKEGKVKNIFNQNAFGQFLLNQFRKYVKDPISEDGTVKKGWLNYLLLHKNTSISIICIYGKSFS